MKSAKEMNKYDEAIGNIARYCCDYRTGIFPPQHELHGELDILMELVEKEEPKKVILSNSRYRCPNCGGILAFDYTGICLECQNVRCGGCGQALDWSKSHDK